MFRRLLAISVPVAALAAAAAPAGATPAATATAAATATGFAAPGTARHFVTRWIPFEGHRLYVRDYPGRGPAFVLMHGFPDNLHLYDRLVPLLRGHRTITFDFLGWGRSDKPRGHTYTFSEQEAELGDVVQTLRLQRVIPVVHDASGPAGINWSLSHSGQVTALVLLNTFYSAMATANPPEAIRLFSDPSFSALAQAIAANRSVSRWLYTWQVGRFMSNATVRDRMLNELWPQFIPSVPAFVSLNRDLGAAVAADTAEVAKLRAFDRPVRIVWGARDPYLNAGMARSFNALFANSQLFLLPARHYVQVDVPARVARLLLSVVLGRSQAR